MKGDIDLPRNQDESKKNLYQKMTSIRKSVEVIRKDKAGYGYKYTTDEAILACITGRMNTLHVSLIPKIVPGTSTVVPLSYKKTKVAKNGQVYEENVNEMVVSGEMEWHWVNDDNPDERIVIPWFMCGQQSDCSQAMGSGLSYASRYFKLIYFQSATTEDDPDAWRGKQAEAEKESEKQIAKSIIENISEKVEQYVALHPEDRDKITEIVKKYARNNNKPTGNYMHITNPRTAAALQKELFELFGVTAAAEEEE